MRGSLLPTSHLSLGGCGKEGGEKGGTAILSSTLGQRSIRHERKEECGATSIFLPLGSAPLLRGKKEEGKEEDHRFTLDSLAAAAKRGERRAASGRTHGLLQHMEKRKREGVTDGYHCRTTRIRGARGKKRKEREGTLRLSVIFSSCILSTGWLREGKGGRKRKGVPLFFRRSSTGKSGKRGGRALPLILRNCCPRPA